MVDAPVAPAQAIRRRLLHRRAARHVGRGAHHVLRWFGAVAAILILLAMAGMWRMMQGPVELDWLAPYVEAAFAQSASGLKVAISGVRFGIDRDLHQLDLRAEDVRVSLPSGAPLASFPEMATSFSLAEMLRGRLTLTRVVVERPVVRLQRDAGGAITARVAAGDEAGPALGPQILEQLAGPREADAPLGLLRELRVRGATVIVEDQRSGQTWRADRVDLATERSGKGVRGDFSLAVPVAGRVPELRVRYRYFADRQVLDLDMAIDGVEPADIPPLIPELAQLQHVEAPLSGTLRTRIDLAARRPEGSRLDLTLGEGRVRSQWLPGGDVAVAGGQLHAVYAPESSEIRIEKLALDLGGGTELAIVGNLAGVTPELIAAPEDARPPGHVTGKLAAALRRVPAARLGALWPTAFSPGARHWVTTNIPEGMLDEAALRLDLDLDPVAHAADVLNAEGTLRYHDLTINYFNGLQPVRKVNGTASLKGKRLDFAPIGGSLKGLKVTGGAVQINDLGGPVEWLTIDLSLAGPLQDSLEVIDAKPLRYVHAVGVDPAHVGGRAETQLHFKLPLLADLKLEAVEYGAKATISGGSLDKAVLDRGISDANLALEITRTGARAQGTARFDGSPAKLDANVLFHAKSGPRAIYKVGLALDEAAQRRLDLDMAPDRVSGPVALELVYQLFGSERSELSGTIDLRGATLSVPEAGWKKPPDQPAVAKVVLELDGERIARVPHIEVKAPGLEGSLAASVAADGRRIDRVEIRRLVLGETDVSGTVSRRTDGGWHANVHALRADARHMIKDATSGPSAASPVPLAVDARIDRLILGPRRELHKVAATLLRSNGAWQSGRIDGRFANGHRISLDFDKGSGHRLVFRSDDLGATLQLLDIADNVVGGRLAIDGQLSDVAGKRVLRAHVEGENYTLMRAPLVTRILALPSFTGVASMLSGSGLPFASVRGDFTYEGNRLALEQVLAFGEALGVTVNGWVDLDRDTLDVQGTLAPAYMLNSLLGNVPLLGPLLGGGSQGLFAANFRLTGAQGDPQVTVNPLSALAPGILRQLFAPIVGVGTPAPPQEAQAAH